MARKVKQREMETRKFNVKEFGYSVEQHFGNGGGQGGNGMFYKPEPYSILFDELRQALSLSPDYVKMYNAFNRTFNKCLNQNTDFARLNLVGTFAKTDYLLKERHASPALAKAVNDTRVRLRKLSETSAEELEAWHLHDFKTLCLFFSFVYGGVAVPAELAALFPAGERKAVKRQLHGECMRVIVNRWDDNFIYADSETERDVRICYAKGNRNYDFDWTYLRDILYKDAQLNLIRPRAKADIIYPELTIFEPDYLVEISAIARCFESYAESPYIHLLNKLKPFSDTEATVLGNFASQLLDEAIQEETAERSYAESARTFFRNNTNSLLATGITPGFHEEARRQKQNITYAMKKQLPEAVERYDKSNGFVEPSFFSEMLGLQGRMDYIQLDQGILIEQKSGKGGFPYDNFIKPKPSEQHYVQMLLYMLIFRYNYREQYERNRRLMFAFLLYSRYKESLLGLGFAPELVFRALKMRNRIAWTDMLCTCNGGYRILDSMTADKLKTKNVSRAFWEGYKKPEIERLLQPIRDASELERAYFYRFLTFVENEHLLSKIGNKTKENSGFASKWQASLEEKLQSGDICHRLTLVNPTTGCKGRVDTVTLRFADTEDYDNSNFRCGDIVILYPYDEGKEPDARMSMVFRCTIEAIGARTIRLNLRAAQAGAHIFLRDKHRPWAIEHDFFESSDGSLYRGLHAFLNAPKERRDLLLLQRKPETDRTVTLKGDYGCFNTLALRVKQAKDFFLIIGPPGTGKTSFGMLNTVKEELTKPDACVLVLSYTNRAVDEICSKLVEAGIDFIRIGSKFGCADEYRPYLLDTRTERCNNIDDVKSLIASTRVFTGTTTALNGASSLFLHKRFSLAVVDEASQILEPHIIGLLSMHHDGIPSIRKFVMIGDHKQLPAVVQQDAAMSRVDDPALNAIGLTDCRLSLFERLLRRYGADESLCFMLRRQGRMHPDIALFPNSAFYCNRLTAVPLPHQRAVLPTSSDCGNAIGRLLGTRRMAFIATDAPVDTGSDKVNTVEACMIAATVRAVYEAEKNRFDTNRTVGVIVPYRNQIAAIRGCLARYAMPQLAGITIDTVERYQGSQRRYIIYGFTIRKYHQLKFLTDNTFEDADGTIVDRRLNVAMTRAEEHLIMFGNAELLGNNSTFSKLMEFAKSRHSYFAVTSDDYMAGRFCVPPIP